MKVGTSRQQEGEEKNLSRLLKVNLFTSFFLPSEEKHVSATADFSLPGLRGENI